MKNKVKLPQFLPPGLLKFNTDNDDVRSYIGTQITISWVDAMRCKEILRVKSRYATMDFPSLGFTLCYFFYFESSSTFVLKLYFSLVGFSNSKPTQVWRFQFLRQPTKQ